MAHIVLNCTAGFLIYNNKYKLLDAMMTAMSGNESVSNSLRSKYHRLLICLIAAGCGSRDADFSIAEGYCKPSIHCLLNLRETCIALVYMSNHQLETCFIR